MNKEIVLTKAALEKNGFKVKIFKNEKELKQGLLEEIQTDESVSFAGSITLEELGLYDHFKEAGNDIYWHWREEGGKEGGLEAAKEADIYLSSTNALTLNGKIVNMDGIGNRVSSIFYGHERVYIIAGKNKIVKDLAAAKDRIDNIAGPKNAKRLNLNTPCTVTGRCSDCDSPDRICNIEVVIHKNPMGSNINVFLIEEDLGY